jgi:hypothetical protein
MRGTTYTPHFFLSDMKAITLTFLILIAPIIVIAQQQAGIRVFSKTGQFKPLEEAIVVCEKPGVLIVKDARGREYFRSSASTMVGITVAGSVGRHTVLLLNKNGILTDSAHFTVETSTSIADGGKIGDMFRLFHQGMLVYNPDGVSQITWNGKTYSYFVEWVLDNNNTMKGMQYFSPSGAGLVDLLRENQQPNGMIWSFVRSGDDDSHYYNTAYSSLGYFKKDQDAWFVRQPVENHVEYNFVNMIYQQWKASGDEGWMKNNLDCAMRALDYSVTDTVRWSKRFRLLKRPYCIDSWDFQVDDEYTPYAPVSPTMVIVPGKTKFGIFFGDNTGYYEACNQLSEMLNHAGLKDQAKLYQQRGQDILARLNALSWNGHYYRHFIDEDPSVIRHLGVDEKSQIAQGNMYSVNRGLPHDMDVAIIQTYLGLKKKLPAGSPGEWYAIYPPFEKGFGLHNQKWQYMNGGVAGHAAGELARGACENGYEKYGAGILDELYTLGREHGNRVWFALTGSIPPPPPPPHFKTVDISAVANMDLRDQGGNGARPWMNTTRPGNDMRGLPVGDQVFKNVPFTILDPANNQRRAVAAISTQSGMPDHIEIPVGDTAATVYLLHSSSDNIPGNVAGAITFRYADGAEASQYLMKGKEVTNWWFPQLENDHAGVAWWGPNLCSTKVGVCWAAVNNPYPAKKIATLVFHAPLEGGIYVVLGITLSDRVHYIRPTVESFGGPDNWAASNAMAALIEGLAGVKNGGLAYDRVNLSPRWMAAGVDSVDVTVQLAASGGYVAYRYVHHKDRKEIEMHLTGSGNSVHSHVLLPPDCQGVVSFTVNRKPEVFALSRIENSVYADFDLTLPVVQTIHLVYK